MESAEAIVNGVESSADGAESLAQPQYICFVVGEKFSTYDELKEKIEAYERTRNVQFCHSDSRTLEAAKKRAPRKVADAKEELLYYRISLSCVFGGKKYQNRGSGKRPHQR